MIKVDTRELRAFEKDLAVFNKRGLPFATREAINTAAFETRKTSLKIIDQRMIERNTWTRRSVQVDKSRTLDIDKQTSHIGSTQEYMKTQEEGGIETRKGKHGVPIPTSYSSGEGEGARPRKKLPRKANKMANILLAKRRGRYKNQRQKNIAIVKMAADEGIPHVFLRYRGRKKGIFEVKGDEDFIDSVNMLHDLSRPIVRVPATRWLSSSTKINAKRMPFYYKKALQMQLKRAGAFRGHLHN